jgi:uncharacterized membrane protein
MSTRTRATTRTAGGPPPRHLRPRTRRALLSAHVISSVGLLGASAALLLLGITAASTGDPGRAHAAYTFMSMFGYAFGIPLSFSALITGVVLGLGSKWGVLRYPWVTIKLGLLVTTILSGALVIGRVSEQMADGTGGSETQLLAAASYNVVALVTSTMLSIYKPGRRRGPARRPSPA